MGDITQKIDKLNAAIVEAQMCLMDAAMAMDAAGVGRAALNGIRDALADAEYKSRYVEGFNLQPEIY